MIDIGIVTVLFSETQNEFNLWIENLFKNFYYNYIFKYNISIWNNNRNNDYQIVLEAKSFENVKYDIKYNVSDVNYGWCGGNNRAVNYLPSTCKLIFFINPDLYINDSLVFDWMYSASIQRNSITGLYNDGIKWLTYPAMFPTNKIYNVNVLPFAYNFNPREKYPEQNWKSLPYIDGSLMGIPYSNFIENQFDERIFPGYFAELDLQYRLNLKLDNSPIKNMISHNSRSDSKYGYNNKKEWTEEARKYFYEKHVINNYENFLSKLV